MNELQRKIKTVRSDFPKIDNTELLRILFEDVQEELKTHKRRDVLNMFRQCGVRWTIGAFDTSYYRIKNKEECV